MITLKTAKKLIRTKYPDKKIERVEDFGKIYVFSLVNKDAISGIPHLSSTVLPAVNKYSGQVFLYDVVSKIDSYKDVARIKVN